MSDNPWKNTRSIFYSRKALDNSVTLETELLECELTNEARLAYGFSVRLLFGEELDCSDVGDVTGCRSTAEELFDLISRANVFPCHLRDVVEDYLAVV